MWTRTELKTRARSLFKANYWKAVLAALLLAVLAGGGSGAFSGGSSGLSSMLTATASSATAQGTFAVAPVVGLMLAGMITAFVLIALAITIAVDILLINPLEVGIRRFFIRNMFEKAQIRELTYGFDHSYKNIIHVMFFRDLHIFLWSLLFIIPGIVKSYEYRMIPYLLAEYPDMPKDDAFAISRYMMTGNKWKTFVLDLSFLLWIIGSACTLGLLGLFYGDPYMAQTGAVLYDALKAEKQPFAQQAAPEPVLPAEPAADAPATDAPTADTPEITPADAPEITAAEDPGMDNSQPQDYNETEE